MIRQVFREKSMGHTCMSEWKSQNSPKVNMARHVMSKVKSMIIIFFDIMRIVYKEFILTG
jgi:hypothetical protein